uniref:Uncharacterized protein n=1 Tax=Salix viminalis TaxID=40686 RepID=A0A6N2KQ34_SALVM
MKFKSIVGEALSRQRNQQKKKENCRGKGGFKKRGKIAEAEVSNLALIPYTIICSNKPHCVELGEWFFELNLRWGSGTLADIQRILVVKMATPTVSKTRSMLEGLVREGSFKWLLGKRSYFNEELEEMERSPSAGRNWIAELSPLANLVVRRCSKILGISASELQESFNEEASDTLKHPSCYARNFLEYCCFRALALSTQVTGHLADKKFRQLIYDMMLAWETPAVGSQPLLNADEDLTVGLEAFSRIAPAVPLIANVIISENLFEVLTVGTDGRLLFSIYEKYLMDSKGQ